MGLLNTRNNVTKTKQKNKKNHKVNQFTMGLDRSRSDAAAAGPSLHEEAARTFFAVFFFLSIASVCNELWRAMRF